MWMLHRKWILQVLRQPVAMPARHLSYVQGQMYEGQREYFYYIDHQGQLFMDDTKVKNFVTCFKDKTFLRFFFKRLRLNKSGRYSEEFPFTSPCGPEMNFVRCDDQPVVFTHLVKGNGGSYSLAYGGYADTLTIQFQPEKLCMLPRSGRLYHPGPDQTGGIGLVKSLLAIELSQQFLYQDVDPDQDCPTHFVMDDQTFELDHSLLPKFANCEEVAALQSSRKTF